MRSHHLALLHVVTGLDHINLLLRKLMPSLRDDIDAADSIPHQECGAIARAYFLPTIIHIKIHSSHGIWT
jgi:hypothetical protein